MRRLLTTCVLLASGALVACGPSLPPPQNPAQSPARARRKPVRINMEPFKLKAVKGPDGPRVEVLDATSLFDHGGRMLSAKKYKKALEAYDRLLSHFPSSRFISSSLYNAGLAHEYLGQFGKAAKRYTELIRRYGARKDGIDAAFRLGGCYAELQNWPSSAQVFAMLLQRKDLGVSDRVEALARKGLAHFRVGDYRKCRTTLKEAVRFHKGVEATERLDSDFFLAMVHYYLAAMPHVKFRKIKVNTKKKKEMARNLDDKARLLLVSQSRYIRTIKVKNPYWATAAGFQVGSLYREFYVVLLTSLPDFSRQAKTNSRKSGVTVEDARKLLVKVYMEEVHKAVKPLLTKAIRVFEKNITMAQRVGIRSNWIGKSKHQVNELKHLLSLPPAEAIKIIPKNLPENQPSVEPPQEHKKDKPPQTPKPPVKPTSTDDEPGKVIL